MSAKKNVETDMLQPPGELFHSQSFHRNTLRCLFVTFTCAMTFGLMLGNLDAEDRVATDKPAESIQENTAENKGNADKAAEEAFVTEVLPLLKQHCFECHSHATGKAKGGLVLDSRSGWAKGGDSGPAVVPGKLDDSLLIQAVRYSNGTEMPPKGKLPAATIETFERWVKNGAADPRISDPAKVQSTVDIAAGKKHWAFHPVQATVPPQVQDAAWPTGDIDRFLLAKLESKGLQPAPDTDAHTWLRRVSLDLTGLPPSVNEIQAFLRDCEEQKKSQSTAIPMLPAAACERVVDRLLGSRAFGERWGRHWLDLVGYADQIGTANDIFAEHAWRYRDYVIAAFNSDKPFDRFLREQLAGDLLPFDSPQQRAEQLIATGFLLLGDLTIVEADKPKLRIDVADQQVDKIGRAFLALTIGCARCHDHKFDPIAQRDYYAIAGILNSTESVQRAQWGVWSWPTVLDLPESDSQQNSRQALAERQRQQIESWKTDRDRQREQKKDVDAALAKPEAAAADESIRTALTKTQAGLNDRLQRLDADIQHAEFFLATQPKAFAVRDIAEPADMQITIRGNAYALGDKVPRGFLQVASTGTQVELPPRQSGRLQLADWIAGRDNPLTSRVLVNRIWQKLYGEGLVRSIDYFGLPGEKPSHPELLDFLAQQMMVDGWSQKKLIRSLVLSHAYRMSSHVHTGTVSGTAPGEPITQVAAIPPAPTSAAAVDPENRLLWRMNRRRLDAESLRDSLLAVSGKLIDSSGGPSLPLEYRENTGNLGNGVNPPSFSLRKFRPEQEFERTVYLPVIRSGPQAGPGELRNVFDFTQPAEFAGQRPVTAVPTQALFLMNSKLMKDRARDLASRIMASSADETARLECLWLRTFGRPISTTEKTDAVAFLTELRNEALAAKVPEPELPAWTELCHSLLASNEFLMRL
jgi:hypothetical protein